jgi:hypothetical protein
MGDQYLTADEVAEGDTVTVSYESDRSGNVVEVTGTADKVVPGRGDGAVHCVKIDTDDRVGRFYAYLHTGTVDSKDRRGYSETLGSVVDISVT